jgi:poly(3-hydroxybutyrate) depolymerase
VSALRVRMLRLVWSSFMRSTLAIASLLSFVACSSGSDDPLPGGGAGGAGAGTGGQTSTAGTAGSLTTAGTSSSAGSSPVGGAAPTAGSAGVAGSSSTAGSGGVATGGSSGGGGATAAGAGGMSGGGGSAGGGGGAVKSAGCDKARKVMDGNQTLSSGGQNRQWHVKAPKNYDQTHPYRVIFMYHWNYGSINSIVNPPDADQNTDKPYYGIEELSGDSTIFVVPQGLENGWANTGGRDSTFTDAMLTAVTEGLCIDTTRIFTTGFSYGGAMSLKLACTKPDKFRAALVYDTGTFLSGFNQSECKTPIAFFESHGLDDHTFDYDEGLKVLGIFTKLNTCMAQTPPKAADNAHTCVSFEGCSAGHPVRFCNFGKGENNPKPGGPGGHYPSPKDPGQTTSWVPAEAWKFITQF